MLSVGVDPVEALAADARRLGITTPFLSDFGRKVARAYGLPMVWSGKPGHIFILVGKDGVIKWAKDYAIPGENPVMYVSPGEIRDEIINVLDGRR